MVIFMATRQAKGTGSIFKDAQNYWTSQIQIGTYDNGRPKYKRFKSKKRAEVIAKMDEYKLQTQNLTLIADSDNTSLEDYVKNYLDVYKVNSVKPSSLARDYRTYKCYIKEYIGHYNLDQLTPFIIQTELINKMVEKDYSYSTIHKAYVLLNEALKKAVIDNKLIKNPCQGVLQPSKAKYSTPEVKFLNDEEIKKFLDVIAQGRYQNGLAVASIIYTGLRGGELCALKWEDIDFENKSMTVKRNTSIVYDYKDEDNPVRKVIEQESTKTKKGRTIPLSKSAIQIFKQIQDSREWKPEDYVIITKMNCLSVDVLTQVYDAATKVAGIKGKSGIHTLRHTCASLLIRKGVDVKVVSEILGHSSVTFTYNTYVHLVEEQKIKAMNMLDDI